MKEGKQVLLNVIKMMASDGKNQKDFNPKKEVVNLVLNVREMTEEQKTQVTKFLEDLRLKSSMDNNFFIEYKNFHKLKGKAIAKAMEEMGVLGMREGVQSGFFVFKKSEIKKNEVRIIIKVVENNTVNNN